MGYEYYFDISVLGQNGESASRTIRANGNTTLDELCEVITFAFSFTHEHSYEFALDDSVLASDSSIDSFHLRKGQEIVLRYDFGDEWRFRIIISKIYKTEFERPCAIIAGAGFVLQYPPINGDDEKAESDGLIEPVDSAD